MRNNKLLVVILKDDYGIPANGPSYEYQYFFSTLRGMFQETRLFDFGPYLEKKVELQIDLMRTADAFQPDLIFFVLYKDNFTLETLTYLKKRYTTVNWFCDDQWRFDDFSSRYCNLFSYCITTDHFAVPKYHRIGYFNVLLSQWASDRTISVMPANINYKYDVSFIGGRNPYRAWFIKQLRKCGIHVTPFGSGWENKRVSYNEMLDIFLQSKINLNISNSKNFDIRYILSSFENFNSYRYTSKNREQIKGRHFEIPAAGGFQLTNYVEFIERYYRVGEELAVYGTIDEAIDTIQYYLATPTERVNIALAGLEKTKAEHTFAHRFSLIIPRILVGDQNDSAHA